MQVAAMQGAPIWMEEARGQVSKDALVAATVEKPPSSVAACFTFLLYLPFAHEALDSPCNVLGQPHCRQSRKISMAHGWDTHLMYMARSRRLTITI